MTQSRWCTPVIKEQFLAGLNSSLGKDANAMIAVDHHNFGIAVWVDRVVGKTDLVTLACCVHHKIYTEHLVWHFLKKVLHKNVLPIWRRKAFLFFCLQFLFTRLSYQSSTLCFTGQTPFTMSNQYC